MDRILGISSHENKVRELFRLREFYMQSSESEESITVLEEQRYLKESILQRNKKYNHH